MTETKTERKSVIFLVDRDNPGTVVSWACGQCGTVAADWDRADRCCCCYECRTPLASKIGWGYCSPECRQAASIRRNRECEERSKEQARKEREERKRRPRVHWKDVTGPVSDDYEIFAATLSEWADDFLERVAMDDAEFTLQPIATTCRVERIRFDVENALERAMEDSEYFENAYWTDEAELVEFVAAWNAKQTSETWWGNYDLIDWTGYPWLDHLSADPAEDALRAEVERQIAEASVG